MMWMAVSTTFRVRMKRMMVIFYHYETYRVKFRVTYDADPLDADPVMTMMKKRRTKKRKKKKKNA
jgi:hypothetical protein